MSGHEPLPGTDGGIGLICILAIAVWATSPAKWQTFKRMSVAFVATSVLGILLGLLLGWLQGNPNMTGAVTEFSVGVCAPLAAVLMGRQYVQSLKEKK